jgi:hypothetical protein
MVDFGIGGVERLGLIVYENTAVRIETMGFGINGIEPSSSITRDSDCVWKHCHMF